MTKKQATNMEVKKNNRNLIFRYIRRHDMISNPDISYALKMSLPTVTQNTKELIERGLVEEAGELQSTGGRRAKALSVPAGIKLAAGLDITKNHIGLVLTDLRGDIIQYCRIVLPYTGNEAYYREVNGRLESFLEENNADREKILGLGISFPGIVDLERERIAHSHVLAVDALPFSSISRFFAYPCFFMNDANAGAYAEGMQSEEEEPFFYFSLSNTVGGAFFDGNRLMQGKGFRCGEVGHMTLVPGGMPCYCGKEGCLDAYCSALRLADAAEGKLALFFERLAEGDEKIKEIWEQYAAHLAVAINNIHMILDCDIVLGGYVGSYMEEHMREIRAKVAKRNTFAGGPEDGAFVRNCSYKNGAAALGASRKVLEAFIEQI